MIIASVRRLLYEDRLEDENCPHCKAHNSLNAKIYGNIFMLAFLPFPTGKVAEVECIDCKKSFSNTFKLPREMRRKAMEMRDDAKYPWFVYMGIGLLAALFIASLFVDRKPVQ